MRANLIASLVAKLPSSQAERNVRSRVKMARDRLATDSSVVGSLGELYGHGTESTVGAEVARASVKPPKGEFLYRLTRIVDPALAVEFGGGFGFSGAYIAAALRDNGSDGRLISVEGAPSRAKVVRETINFVAGDRATVVNSRFEDVLGKLDDAELFFLDGYHTLDPTLDFVGEAVQRMRQPGLLILDDIHWSEGMEEAWGRLATDARFTWSADVRRVGLLARGPLSLTKRLPRLWS